MAEESRKQKLARLADSILFAKNSKEFEGREMVNSSYATLAGLRAVNVGGESKIQIIIFDAGFSIARPETAARLMMPDETRAPISIIGDQTCPTTW